MNIVTPIPSSFAIPTANLNTEAARRDNLVRETIPQASDAKQGSAEQGLGSESDKLKSSVKLAQPLTYERPQPNQTSQGQSSADQQFNNTEDESTGKEDARERQQQQSEQREVETLKQRDQEVRAHEQAHASAGGQFAGSPQFDFQRGPDGQRYAVDGQVSIDISSESTPEATIRKMQQVRTAALAPAEPSPQDLQVAAEASRIAFDARNEIAKERKQNVSGDPEAALQPPSLDDIVDVSPADIPTRKLEELAVENDIDSRSAGGQRSLDIEDMDVAQMQQRNQIIAGYYQAVYQPASQGFTATA
ncbi:hypothetical protein FJ444_08795 [Aestuariibacter sp. GS-14]|uniref:putative metalloprotease CJM1_0395 family protein n=1 Tax=Aestuariibacter sp. GS-14 TaxID=2590670 RepID=UPI00112E5A13|nr:putative metalloprotease CJM1_0395 family protein [Aestuariibacter sp. GS-14]TPV59135.1 hypothetical protein FJ444_08795 [Aestuariibacter sp. GS-14]